MQRVSRSTAVATLPSPPSGGTPGFFAKPDPVGGVPATVPGYEWFNWLQEELVAIATMNGATLDGAQFTQARDAIIAKFAQLNSPVFTGGAEGGQISLQKPASGSSIVADVAIDLSFDSLRFFESGGTNRGCYIDVSTLAAGALSKIWHSTNDGTGSGLDADLLDGLHSTDFATAAQVIGLGQTWQNVTSSRALGTTYYNTTGKAIHVAVTNFMSGYIAGALTISIDGVMIVSTGAESGVAGAGFGGAMVIVPAGSSYSATCPTYGSLNKWMEFK